MNEHADPRAFTYAIGASLALHAILLALHAPEPQPPPAIPSVTVTAHLAEPEAAPPPAPPTAREPRPVVSPPRSEKPRQPPKVARAEPAPPKPSAFSVPPAAPSPVESPPATSDPAPAPAPAPEAVPGPLASAPPAPPAPDLSTLIAQYRSQFIGAAVRYKRYPLAARDNGWEGEVVVRLEVSASGELAELSVKKSSGYPVLDEQALEMFRLASPQVPLPGALRGRAFGFDVRAIYSLKD